MLKKEKEDFNKAFEKQMEKRWPCWKNHFSPTQIIMLQCIFLEGMICQQGQEKEKNNE